MHALNVHIGKVHDGEPKVRARMIYLRVADVNSIPSAVLRAILIESGRSE